MKLTHSLAAVSILVLCARSAEAGERFAFVPITAVLFDDPAPAGESSEGLAWWQRGSVSYEAYVVLDTPGEVYLDFGATTEWMSPQNPRGLVVRLEGDASAITGRWFAPSEQSEPFSARRFHASVTGDDPQAREQFYAAMEARYRRLRDSDFPGGTWFRHQIDVARNARGSAESTTGEDAAMTWSPTVRGFDDTFDLFTGSRALAENLDLDRALRGMKDEEATIDIASIEGVQTRAMDWKALVKDLEPELDPLAKLVPADQHAVFFPSFSAMVTVFDEVDRAGTPLLEFLDASCEDQRTKQRYQEQLCLPLSSVSRLLGPAVVKSVAITGSDPLLPSGTDLAILFECKEPTALEKLVMMRHLEAKNAGAAVQQSTAGSLKYGGVRSEDRRVCSYIARSGDTLIVTNSTVQLARIAAALDGATPAIASADEYVWFRERYKRGDPSESALLVLTDATIRRWAGPRARIADSRRIRAAAAMAEIQARQIDALVANELPAGTSAAAADLPMSGDFTWTARGVRSAQWGTLEFLTPVAELPLDKVMPSEKQAYENFRRGFENRWRNVFDPIALRFSFSEAQLGADLTVMPLVVNSDYRDLRRLTEGASLSATAGDPHAEALAHFAFGFGKDSELSRLFSEGVGPFAEQLGADPLGWIGDGVALYLDRDPFWDELRAAPELGGFMEDNLHRLPLALHVEVREPLKLVAFLTALRAMVEGAAPGMTHWENRTWHEQGYVRIGSEDLGISVEELALFYAPLGDGIVFSLREDIVQRAIDRRLARKAGKPDAAATPWLGSSVGLRLDRAGFETLAGIFSGARDNPLQTAAWSALPILNEWKQRYPSEDPVALHERLWGVRLVSPGGGTYAWNEAARSMESSLYGAPALPKSGPRSPADLQRFSAGEFGLSFEGEGLRARVQLNRADNAATKEGR